MARRKLRTGRSVRTGGGRPRKELYQNDPFYRQLTLARRRAYREIRKELINLRARRRRAADPGYRDRERLRRHGLSPEQYREILERQGHACGICRKSDRPLCIDHDHSTGKVRGLLCRNCNIGLGNYGDDPKHTRAATAYLEAARESCCASESPVGSTPGS